MDTVAIVLGGTLGAGLAFAVAWTRGVKALAGHFEAQDRADREAFKRDHPWAR